MKLNCFSPALLAIEVETPVGKHAGAVFVE
jgi:hypothetical protein